MPWFFLSRLEASPSLLLFWDVSLFGTVKQSWGLFIRGSLSRLFPRGFFSFPLQSFSFPITFFPFIFPLLSGSRLRFLWFFSPISTPRKNFVLYGLSRKPQNRDTGQMLLSDSPSDLRQPCFLLSRLSRP